MCGPVLRHQQPIGCTLSDTAHPHIPHSSLHIFTEHGMPFQMLRREIGISEEFMVLWRSQNPPSNTGVGRGLKRGPELSLVSLTWAMNKHPVSIGPQLSEQTCPGHRPHTMPTFWIHILAIGEGPCQLSCLPLERALFTLAHCVALSEFNTDSESLHPPRGMRALTQRL